MVSKSRKPKAGPKKSRVRNQAMRTRAAALASSYEEKLLRMAVDPCGAELVGGLGLPSAGICQRFVKYYQPTVATTENNFFYIWNPNNQSPTSAVTYRASIGTAAPSVFATGPSPGEPFLESNAEAVATLGACMEIMYTGKLTDRKGYIAVCQAPWYVLNDIAASSTTPLTDILTYCQAVSPVPSEAVEIKWAPTMLNLTQNAAVSETGSRTDVNGLMVVCIGVSPTDFVVKLTQAVEYTPKNINGIPAPRVTKTIPIGAGERVVTALDRMGHWWHNVGDALTAANRLGGRFSYAANQAARFVRGASALRGPATTLLALTG